MKESSMRLDILVSIVVAGALAASTSANADVVTCQRAVAKASTQYVQAIAKATDKCENAVVKSGGGTCPDAKTTAALDKASVKLASAIAKGCGGSDRTCNSDEVDEDLPAAIGWPAACPGLALQTCDDPIHTCADVATCLACLGTTGTDATSGLAYDALALPSTADATLNRCQRALGKANAAYVRGASKAIARCWDARLTGKHADPCVPPAAGDGKYLAAIAKAGAKRTDAIAKACGGTDQALGGGDDLTPAAIGFAASCPDATVPGGSACAGPVGDLTGLVGCLACVTDAAVACVDRAAVPALTPYPPECAACLAPPTSGPCPTTIALAARGERVDLDVGFTGLGHDGTLPSNNGLTLAVSGCDGTDHPTCGECDLAGPVTGAGGPSDVSRRCGSHTEDACSADADCHVCLGGGNADAPCTTASECPGGTCDDSGCLFFLGPPQGLFYGIPLCVLNEIAAPVSGTLNLTSGSAALSLTLRTRVHVGGTPEQPCPSCVAGVCVAGPRDGLPCTEQGTGQTGPVSLDCPPHPGTLAGTFALDYPLSTDVQSRGITADSPTCRQTGFTSFQCLCDTCNGAGQDPCAANADCPPSGGAPGICGGRRCLTGSEVGKPCNQCLGGANHGATCVSPTACPGGTCPTGCGGICVGGPNEDAACTTSSECPGSTCQSGQCGRPGEATQPNSCSDDTVTPGALDCVPTANGEGVCAAGPSDQRCAVDAFVACTLDADCLPVAAGGACATCTTAGQLCVTEPRACFTDNGTAGNPVLAVGVPGAPCGDVARPTLAGMACVAPVSAAAVNAGYGLPALSRVRLPFTFVP